MACFIAPPWCDNSTGLGAVLIVSSYVHKHPWRIFTSEPRRRQRLSAEASQGWRAADRTEQEICCGAECVLKFCSVTGEKGGKGARADIQATLCLQCCLKKERVMGHDIKRWKNMRSVKSLASPAFFFHQMKQALYICLIFPPFFRQP